MAFSVDFQKILLRETQLDFPGNPYSVSVLKVGYYNPQPDGTFRADGTVTLITGDGNNILVDTGGPWSRDFLVESLRKKGLEPGDIQLVVGTHGHSDHVGNLNLFPSAVVIVGYDLSRGDIYRPNKMAQGHAHVVDEHECMCAFERCGPVGWDVTAPVWYYSSSDPDYRNRHVCVVPSPGHSGQDVSVQVKGTSVGTILVAGDLFDCCADDDMWRDLSLNPAAQETSRQQALRTADVIIPGHGLPFRVLRNS